MKTCTKCKRDLDHSNFVKSDRYLDGLYPSCKECRNEVRKKWMAKQPFCVKCKVNTRYKADPYCRECRRIIEGKNPVPKYIRKANTTDPNFCSKCGIRPPRDYNAWCQPCVTEYNRQWRRTKAGTAWKTVPEVKRKKTARHYVNTLYKRGKISRKPCYLCGESSHHFHHLSYEDRSLSVIDLCMDCHVRVHRALRKLLTINSP